ncbi:MAG: ComEA family DNA-binding protein [Thiothrix sp.]|nr:ComEA family DNA-binding protein [Thiothrix sp.]
MPVFMKVARIASFAALVLYSAVSSAETVNINTADAQTIHASLKGIGEKKAQAIINYREEHGPFTNIEDIMKVKGIGTGIFKKVKEDLILDSQTPEKSALETEADPNGLETISTDQQQTEMPESSVRIEKAAIPSS